MAFTIYHVVYNKTADNEIINSISLCLPIIYSLAVVFRSRDISYFRFTIRYTSAFKSRFFEAVFFFLSLFKSLFLFYLSMSDVTDESQSLSGVTGNTQLPGVAPGVTGKTQLPGVAPGVTGNTQLPGVAPGVTGNTQLPGVVPGVTGNTQLPGLAGNRNKSDKSKIITKIWYSEICFLDRVGPISEILLC